MSIEIRTTVYIAVSTDGFIAREDGDISWLPHGSEDGDDLGWGAFIGSVDVLVMGRSTFEMVASFEGPWPYPVPVVVLSRSLSEIPERLADKARLMAGEPAEILTALAAEGHRHAYLDGGVTVQQFLRAGLIDTLILTRIPVLIGSGIPLFGALDADVHLTHEQTTTHAGGLVQSRYAVSRAGRSE